MALARRPIRTLKLRVPISTSNLGSGFDALGIALNHHLEVRWTAAESNQLERRGALEESVLPFGRDPVLRGMRRAAILNGKNLPTGSLIVNADIAPARGVGLSGAGLVAGLLLGARLTGGEPDRSALLKEAIELEGHPENATASMQGGAHWSLQDPEENWIHLPLVLHRDLRFLLIVPPYPMSTKRAREVLPKSVSLQRAVAQAQRPPILLEGLRKLEASWIAAGIRDELHVGVRIKQLTGMASMLSHAEGSGAIGATLSGAGSSLLVLTRTSEAEGLQQRLAKRVKRLWGESGSVVLARAAPKGAAFA